MPETDQKERKGLTGEIVDSPSSDAVITGKFEHAARLAKLGKNAPLVDAQYEDPIDVSRSVSTLSGETGYDGYKRVDAVTNPQNISDFGRNVTAQRADSLERRRKKAA